MEACCSLSRMTRIQRLDRESRSFVIERLARVSPSQENFALLLSRSSRFYVVRGRHSRQHGERGAVPCDGVQNMGYVALDNILVVGTYGPAFVATFAPRAAQVVESWVVGCCRTVLMREVVCRQTRINRRESTLSGQPRLNRSDTL